MSGTIFLSGSRGGMLVITVELIVLGVVLVKMQSGVKVAASLGVFASLMVVLLIWIGGLELTKRVATVSTRDGTWREYAGSMLVANPWSPDEVGSSRLRRAKWVYNVSRS